MEKRGRDAEARMWVLELAGFKHSPRSSHSPAVRCVSEMRSKRTAAWPRKEKHMGSRPQYGLSEQGNTPSRFLANLSSRQPGVAWRRFNKD